MYEIQGCVDDCGDIYAVTDDEAEFFGVYFRGESGLADWIEDFNTKEEAENFVATVQQGR